jgi:hypothetical protein
MLTISSLNENAKAIFKISHHQTASGRRGFSYRLAYTKGMITIVKTAIWVPIENRLSVVVIGWANLSPVCG